MDLVLWVGRGHVCGGPVELHRLIVCALLQSNANFSMDILSIWPASRWRIISPVFLEAKSGRGRLMKAGATPLSQREYQGFRILDA
jgi:hypothetical protein